jgi:hypothetical protein
VERDDRFADGWRRGWPYEVFFSGRWTKDEDKDQCQRQRQPSTAVTATATATTFTVNPQTGERYLLRSHVITIYDLGPTTHDQDLVIRPPSIQAPTSVSSMFSRVTVDARRRVKDPPRYGITTPLHGHHDRRRHDRDINSDFAARHTDPR